MKRFVKQVKRNKTSDKGFKYVDLEVIDLDKEDFDENKKGSDKLNIYQEKEFNFINKKLDTGAIKAKQLIKEKKNVLMSIKKQLYQKKSM